MLFLFETLNPFQAHLIRYFEFGQPLMSMNYLKKSCSHLSCWKCLLHLDEELFCCEDVNYVRLFSGSKVPFGWRIVLSFRFCLDVIAYICCECICCESVAHCLTDISLIHLCYQWISIETIIENKGYFAWKLIYCRFFKCFFQEVKYVILCEP